MKLKITAACFALSAASAFSFTVATANFSNADSTAVPILDNAGNAIAAGSGFVAAGTFSEAPTLENIQSAFTPFGAGTTTFENSFGAAGLFDTSFFAPIPEGSSDAPVGEQGYVVIGDATTLADSTVFAVLTTGNVFGTDDAFGNGGFSDVFTSDNISSSVVIGELVSNVDTGLGVDFTSCLLYTSPSPRDRG